MSSENTVNPKGLPTFKSLEPMPIDPRMSPFYDGSFMGGGSYVLRAVIKAVEEAGYTLTGLFAETAHEDAVFSLLQGSGKACISTTPHDFIVRAYHPAMGDFYEVHACENAEQILAVLSTVSYG